ncbi:MAG: transposase family protein [Acidiferrobacteraceae bacterium]
MERDDLKAAITRYTAVAIVLAKVAAGMKLARAVNETVGQCVLDHRGQAKKLTRRSLYRWVATFKSGGLEALADTPRTMKEPTRILSSEFIDFLTKEKTADKDASLPEVIRRAVQSGVIQEDEAISRSTVWRAAVKLNLPLFTDKGFLKDDKRRFAYPHRMQMVITDGKKFRAGIGRKRRVSMTFLDDATRFGLTGVVGYTETTALFLRGLWQVIEKWGLMVAIFVDNGSGFISHDTMKVCANLKISLIHGTESYPEGHGKIEKYHQSQIADLLRGLDGSPDVDPSLPGLEHRLMHYLAEMYNPRPHASLEMQAPSERFLKDPMPLRPAFDLAEIRRAFLLTKKRRVSRDHIVQVKGKLYETPAGYAGKIIKVFHHVLDGTVEMLHEQRLIKLAPPDLALNAITPRATKPTKKKRRRRDEPRPMPPKTSATMAYEKAFGSIVGPDGGFHSKE